MNKARRLIALVITVLITISGAITVSATSFDVENIEPEINGLIPMEVASDDVTAGFDELKEIDLSEEAISEYSEDGLDTSVGDIPELNLSGGLSDEEIENLRSYSSRDKGLVTSIKDQGTYGSCWAHAAMAQAETSAIMQGMSGTGIDLSEFHLGYFAYSENNNKYGGVIPRVTYGSSSVKLSAGGNDYYAISELMNWHGIAQENDYPYALAKTTPYYNIEQSDTHNYIVSDYYLLPTKNSSKESVKKVLKYCIYKYGAVGWSYYSTSGLYSYGVDYKGSKCTTYSTISTNSATNKTNHAITVVGWDDDFPIEKFPAGKRPSEPGAWIIKNSYGTKSNSDGFFYISYEEPTLGTGNPASVVIVKKDVSKYDNNYFNSNGITNDNRVYTVTNTNNKVANVYKAGGELPYEKITAVSFLLNTPQSEYSVQLYKNPITDSEGIVTNPESGTALLESPITGKTAYAGLTTVEIPTNVYIDHGDIVSAVLTMSDGTQIMYDSTYATRTDVGFVVSQPAILGKSYILDSNGQFYDVNKGKTDGNGRYYRLNIITENIDNKNDDDPEEHINPVEHKPNTWEYFNGKKYYYNSSINTLTGWKNIKGKDGITRRYFFNSDGSVKTGIYKDSSNKSYYLESNIPKLTKEEYKLIKHVVRAEELIADPASANYNPDLYKKIVNEGAVQKGEITIGELGDKHIFANSKGVISSGWQKVVDNKGTNSKNDDTVTWKYYNTEEYGFTEHNDYEPFVASGPGALKKSDYPHWVSLTRPGKIQQDYYCFTSPTKLAKGWSTVKRNFNYEKIRAKYYFDKKSGEMYRGWQTVDGSLKYFGILSGVYCADTSRVRGITEENGSVYCLSPKGKPKTGWQKISYRHEVVDEKTGLVSYIKSTGRYYFEPDKNSPHYGEMYVGFKMIKGKLWYFSEDDAFLTERVNGTRGMACTGVVNLNRLGVSSNTISRNGIEYTTAYNPEGTNTYYMLKKGGIGTGYIKNAVNEFGNKNSQKWTLYCNPSGGSNPNISPVDAPLTEIEYNLADGSKAYRKYRYGEAIGGYTDGTDGVPFTKWSEAYSIDTPYHYDLKTGVREKTLVYYHGGYYGYGISGDKYTEQVTTVEAIRRYADFELGMDPSMEDDVPEIIYATMSEDYPLAASSYIDSERYLNAQFPDGTVIENRSVYNPSYDYVAGNAYEEGKSYTPGYKYAANEAQLGIELKKVNRKISGESSIPCLVLNVKRVSENSVDYSAPQIIRDFTLNEMETRNVTVEYRPAASDGGVIVQKRDGIVNVYDVEAYTKASYEWLCKNIGAENMVLLGTSSGAATAASIAQWAAAEQQTAKDSGYRTDVKAPANLVVVSGWLDASLNSCNTNDIKQSGNGVDYRTLVYWGKRYTNVSTKPCTGENKANGATTDEPSNGKDQYIVNYAFASPVTSDAVEKNNRSYVNLNNVTVFVAKKDPCRASGNLFRKAISRKTGTRALSGASLSDAHGYMFQKNSNNGVKTAKIIANICGHE